MSPFEHDSVSSLPDLLDLAEVFQLGASGHLGKIGGGQTTNSNGGS